MEIRISSVRRVDATRGFPEYAQKLGAIFLLYAGGSDGSNAAAVAAAAGGRETMEGDGDDVVCRGDGEVGSGSDGGGGDGSINDANDEGGDKRGCEGEDESG
mmetsp:Transcript_24350/g.43649  ORF Transcript_24350/g.43649 Transcript_24350/m.43649 type:complete len:102 (-) Transcript_24350:2125-2430(-)